MLTIQSYGNTIQKHINEINNTLLYNTNVKLYKAIISNKATAKHAIDILYGIDNDYPSTILFSGTAKEALAYILGLSDGIKLLGNLYNNGGILK